MWRLLFIFAVCCLSSCLFAQQSVSLDIQNADLKTVIHQLQTNSPVVFSYTENLTSEYTFSLSVTEQPLQEVLLMLFTQTDIDFDIVSDQYIVLKKQAAAPINLCGKVLGFEGTPLSFANLLSLRSAKGTSTDNDGNFSWQDYIRPQDSLEISYVGYQTLRLPASYFSTCPNVQLSLESFSISEVVIKEYITSGIEQAEELDHVVLHPDKISVVPGLTEADVLQMVQILPGVQSIDESATGLHIRGGTPDQNLILWDGIPMYNSGHFFGMISAFNPYIVDDVKVYRSGFDAAYGGRVSGVIDIQSIESIPEKGSGSIGLNFTHADASAVIPIYKKSALVISGRRAYTDIIESPTYRKLSQRVFQRGKISDSQEGDDDEDIDYNLSLNFADYNVKWLWQPNEKDHISVGFFRIFDRFNFFVQSIEDEFQSDDDVNLNNIGTSAKWQRNWSDRLQSKLRASYTHVENLLLFNFQEIEDDQGFSFRSSQSNDIKDFSVLLDNDLRINNQVQFNFGYQFSDLNVSRQLTDNEEEGENEIEDAGIHSAYFTLNSKISPKVNLKTGLRTSYSMGYENIFIAPRLAINFTPSPVLQVKASAGRYYQFISQAIELNDLGLNQEVWVLADDEATIPISQSDHYTAGALINKGKTQIELEAFYKNLKGLTSFSPIFINNLQEDNEAEGSGKAWGLDILLKHRWKNYETWLSYSYSRVFYKFDIYSNNQPFAAPQDRPHSLTSMHQLKFKNWNFSMSWKLASGKVYTEANGFFMDEDDDVALPDYNYENTNENRLPIFHRLDASLLYRFGLSQDRLKGMIGCSILNLYNRRNILDREYLAFYEDEIESFIVEPLDRPMLRFTPNLVFRLSW